MVALIDADGIFWIIAYNHRDIPFDEGRQAVEKATDSFIYSILTLTKSDEYLGFIGTEDKKCFRDNTYKYNHYKGNRPPEPDWVQMWKPIIRGRMISKWHFLSVVGLEADDLVSFYSDDLRHEHIDYIICSPDKDMKQKSGLHFDYKCSEIDRAFSEVSVEEANLRLWIQVISGDSSDNISGIPGLGDVKAKKLLTDIDLILYKSTVLAAYCRYFGPHYGPIIFRENYIAIMLMSKSHPIYGSEFLFSELNHELFISPYKSPVSLETYSTPFE